LGSWSLNRSFGPVLIVIRASSRYGTGLSYREASGHGGRSGIRHVGWGMAALLLLLLLLYSVGWGCIGTVERCDLGLDLGLLGWRAIRRKASCDLGLDLGLLGQQELKLGVEGRVVPQVRHVGQLSRIVRNCRAGSSS